MDSQAQQKKPSKRLIGAMVVAMVALTVAEGWLLWNTRGSSPVAAAFTRVGGLTRAETAVRASRFWVMPPQCVVTISAGAGQAAMFGAARRAMAYDAPLLFISRNPKRRRQVRATIDSWHPVPLISQSPEQPLAGGNSQPEETVPFSCPTSGYAGGVSRVSTLEVSNQLLQNRLPIAVRHSLAPDVVFAVARGPGDAPDAAVGLALAAHMASAAAQTATKSAAAHKVPLRVAPVGVAGRYLMMMTVTPYVAAPQPLVSLVVVPRFLEAAPKLEQQLRNQHELVQGGVVLGSTHILPEETHTLLRQILHPVQQQGVLGPIQGDLGLVGSLIAVLLPLLGAAAATVLVVEVAPTVVGKIVEYVHLASPPAPSPPPEPPPGPSPPPEPGGVMGDTVNPPQPDEDKPESDGFTALEPGRTVTIWLRSGWKVTGTISSDNSAERVFFRFDKATAVKQRDRQSLRKAGPQDQVAGEPVLVPVQDIELITVVPE